MTLEDLHRYAMRLTTGFFADHKELPAIFIGVDSEESLHLIVATGWADKKEFCSLFITGYFYVHGIKMYAYTSEVWFTEYMGAEIPKNLDDMPRPSKDPRRKEGLVCGVVNTSRVYQTLNYILRDADGKGSCGGEYRPGAADTARGDARAGGLLTELIIDESEVQPGAKEDMLRMLKLRELHPRITPSIPIINVIKPQEYTAPSFNS